MGEERKEKETKGMGRHIKNSKILNWMTTRIPNGNLRRTEALNRTAIIKTISKIISYITPLQLAMTNLEFHSGPNQELKIIISGTKSQNEIIKKASNLTSASVLNIILRNRNTFSNFASTYKISVQEISEDSLKFDPIILAKAIASDRNHRKLLGSHIWTQNFSGLLTDKATEGNIASNDCIGGLGSITGIRIEIKGIAGKMTMSKKIIKTFGTLKFNSSSSIINFGEARSINNQRGLIGVKVWIATR